MKAIRFYPNVPADVRAIEQKAALTILEAIHRYAETGAGGASSRSAASLRACFASASAITASSSLYLEKTARSERDAKDAAILNRRAARLNREAADVLEYQDFQD